MRILHLLASPVFSGPAENVALLALAQRALGHDVSVAVDRKRPKLADEEPAVPRLKALDLLDEQGLELSVKSLPWTMAKDVLTLRSLNADVVHTHFSHDHHVARFGKPKGAVLIRSVHAPRSLRHLPSADGYTVPTDAELAALPKAPNRILTALIAPGLEPAAHRDPNLIGMVSHFQPSRRHELALHAFAALRRQKPDARLLLLGDGPTRPEMEALAKSLEVEDAVTFAGYRQGDAFVNALQSLNVLWILGLGNDWSARTALQARACDVAVVAVNEGALPRWADAITELDAERLATA
ncbi:MAG: glycosyltransferase, partial [Myxococcaceae bacterium]